MKATVEKIENHQVVLEITVPAEELSKAIAHSVQHVASRVNIPGFRRGKAPRRIVEQHVGVDAILQEALEHVAPGALSQAIDENQIEIVTRPEIEVVTLEEGKDLVFKATATEKPEVKLGEYKNLKVETEAAEVSDDEVEHQLVHMLDRYADMVDAGEDAAVENDSFITLDFKGFVDGEAFQGGEGKDYPLQIGSGSFIPGFEDQLVGAKVGEETDVNVTFPEEYHETSLAGKAAVFKCTVRSIKKKVVPALDDEFAKKASTFQTLDELKADIRSKLEKNAASQAESKAREDALQMVADNAEVEIPTVMVDNRVTTMIQELALRLEQQGLKMDQYLQYTGTDMGKIRESYREAAEKNVKLDLVLEAVAKAENIKVEPSELDAEVEAMAAAYGATASQVKKIITQQGRIGDLAATIMRRKTAQFVVDNIAK